MPPPRTKTVEPPPSALLPSRAALAALLDAADEALLLFDGIGSLTFCNRAAMRLLGAEPGLSAQQFGGMLGDAALRWLQAALRPGSEAAAPLRVRLGDTRSALLSCWRVQRDLALRVQIDAEPLPMPESLPAVGPGPTLEMLRMLWASPFPATLQDADFRLVAVNDAYLGFTGRSRELLLGTDPVLLQPDEDRATQIESRRELPERLAGQAVPLLREQRLIDSSGRERWCRVSAYQVSAQDGRPLLLCVLQDSTAEHVARAQADRSLNELAQWFDLSPTGMLVFDESGLILRSNPAFEALVEQVPVMLADASPELRALLAWDEGAPRPTLRPGAAPVETHVSLPLPDGRRQRLSARVRGFATDLGQQRFMAVVEDRSAEEERDLAQLEIGALMDTAGVGVATFDHARGWLRPREQRRRSAGRPAGLQAIARDMVEPESLPEYERLQQALRRGERTDVRYAVRHAELGRRWLLTRVEPGDGESGRRTVVTVDVTDQESAQRQSQQLLRELTTILDGTAAGIAYLRGSLLVRCNLRFETMLGLAAGAAAGATTHELFARFPQALAALEAGRSFESELVVPQQGGESWYSMSVRRAEQAPGDNEAVAVLTDISRLKSQQAELEALLRDRELQAERTRAILDSVLVGIVTVGAGGIEWMNRSARRMFGGDLADFAGEPISTVATPEPEHPLRRTDYLHTLADGQVQTFECRLEARDGREFWVVGNAVATHGASTGKQVTFALLDIERRRQAEISIVQARASLQRIIETAPLAIALFDARTQQVLQLNQMAAAFFGRPLAQLMGRAPKDWLGASNSLGADLDAVRSTSEVLRREMQLDGIGGVRWWDTRFVSLPSSPGAAEQVLLVASDVTEQRAEAEKRFEAAIAQREMLVKEVHHRIKNNLQGVAGLLQQNAARHPQMAAMLSESVGQVQAIAQVYGLQVGAGGPLRLASVLEAIALSVQRTFGRNVRVEEVDSETAAFVLPEAESIPIALTINELLTNAVKHSASGDVRCSIEHVGEKLRLWILNPGRLREGFSLAQFPGGVSGLGLVRALLPRRSATFDLRQQGDEVLTEVVLEPPGVSRGPV